MAATRQLTVTVTYSDSSTRDHTADASYSSSDESVATVDNAGLITAVAAGTATVTASFAGLSETCAVTVNATAESLSVEPSTAELEAE